MEAAEHGGMRKKNHFPPSCTWNVVLRGSAVQDFAVVLVTVRIAVVVHKEKLRVWRDDGKASHVVEDKLSVGAGPWCGRQKREI
jgi:hypothetical protein